MADDHLHSKESMVSMAVSEDYSAIESIVGHDDPTAKVTNFVAKEKYSTARSVGTIESFLTIEEETPSESRQPLDVVDEAEVEEDTNIRSQIQELDRVQDEWQASQFLGARTHLCGDVEEFYVSEAGDWLPQHVVQNRIMRLAESPQGRQEGEASGNENQFSEAATERSGSATELASENIDEDNKLDPNPNITSCAKEDIQPVQHDSDTPNVESTNGNRASRGTTGENLSENAALPRRSVEMAFLDFSDDDWDKRHRSTAPTRPSSQAHHQNSRNVAETTEADDSEHNTTGSQLYVVGSQSIISSSDDGLAFHRVVHVPMSWSDDLGAHSPSNSEASGRPRNRTIYFNEVTETFEVVDNSPGLHNQYAESNGAVSRTPTKSPPSSPSKSLTPKKSTPDAKQASPQPYIPVYDEEMTKNYGPGLAARVDSDDDYFIGESRYGNGERRRYRPYYIACLICLVVVAIILAVTLSVTDRSSKSRDSNQIIAPTQIPTTSPTNAMPSGTSSPTPVPSIHTDPTIPPDSALAKLIEISGPVVLEPGTPQNDAYQWLLDEDPAQLDLDSLSDLELQQRYVAALVYFSTVGEEWDDSAGFLGAGDVCQWRNDATENGITCDSDGIISGFVLNENNLAGSLPSELSVLSYLATIELRDNNIAGSVPSEFGELQQLQELDLRQNELSGVFPESIFQLPELRRLLMLRNELIGGTIPDSISMATNLEMISFQYCELSGTLPNTLGDLTNLYFVTLLQNRLRGTIPSGLAQLPLLEVLDLGLNFFTGTIPPFSGQYGLYSISLQGNMLIGTLPQSLGELPGLLFINVQGNGLGGPIPTGFDNMEALVTFDVSENGFTGSLPTFSANRGYLQSVDGSSNQLSGSLDGFMASGPAERLHTINLSDNQFSGSIPRDISRYSSLTDIVLNDNNIGGTIPSEIRALILLDTLRFTGNQFSGPIPETIGNLKKLERLELGNNALTGTIVSELGELSDLSVVDLSFNQLSGTVPGSLSTLNDLGELYLQGNDITGDLDGVFCTTPGGFIGYFIADCASSNPEVVCSCCTTCCDNGSDLCMAPN
eukprot:Nitzschia sp. Nitz4//scaffold2_size372955//38018//41345//NITZ4_000364-RA/size372955-processed-gene-0.471-mRNA-1//-1//CDS//3329546599//8685//frame0